VASTFRVLAVGGLRMAVEAPRALPWRWPRGPLRRFAAEGGRAHVRVSVRVARPEAPPPGSVRYDSGGGIFDVAQVDGDLVVALRIRGALQRVARFDADLREGEVVVAPDSLYARECWYPLAYPLDEVVFLHRILRDGGLLVHACGVARGRRGLVFTGPSGAGKTTIARLLARHAGARVLSDDRVVLRPGAAGGFRLFGTPWHGDGALSEPGAVGLAAVHAIHHAPCVRPERLAGAGAAAALLANAFVPAHDPAGAAAALDLAAALVERTPVMRLGFPKDARVARYAFPSVRGGAGRGSRSAAA
jgi:hypothetical protein